MSSFAELVVVEQLGKVMTIGINRPEVRNCVNPATATQLVTAFDRFEETEEALVAVLYGKGKLVTELLQLVTAFDWFKLWTDWGGVTGLAKVSHWAP